MADTGLLHDAGARLIPWLAGVRPGDAPTTGPRATGSPDPGLHRAWHVRRGVTRCMAPAAEIIVTNVFTVAGSALESDLVPRLVAALGLGVDIFHLTIAAPSRQTCP